MYCHKWSFITAMSECYQKNKCYCLFPWRSFLFPGELRNCMVIVQLCQLQLGEHAAWEIHMWTPSSDCGQQQQTRGHCAHRGFLKCHWYSSIQKAMQWVEAGLVRMLRLLQRKVQHRGRDRCTREDGRWGVKSVLAYDEGYKHDQQIITCLFLHLCTYLLSVWEKGMFSCFLILDLCSNVLSNFALKAQFATGRVLGVNLLIQSFFRLVPGPFECIIILKWWILVLFCICIHFFEHWNLQMC